MPRIDERLADDADRVREVHDPRAGRRAAGGLLGDVEHDRHGPECLGEPARPRGLLPDDPELRRQRLVHEPGRLAADAQLDEDEVGALEGLVAIEGANEAPGPVEPVEHPLGKAADDLEAGLIRIEEHQPVDRHAVAPRLEAFDEFRGVGAPAADHGDLDAHAPSLRCVQPPRRRRYARGA